jgi:hypothetical protein
MLMLTFTEFSYLQFLQIVFVCPEWSIFTHRYVIVRNHFSATCSLANEDGLLA